MQDKVFYCKSAVDRWFYAVVALATISAVFAVAAAWPAMDQTARLISASCAAAALLLPLWILLRTDYSVADEVLCIRSGPFRWNVAISQIHEIRPSRSILSSPALSLNRLEIRYGKSQRVLVSPLDRPGLLAALDASEDLAESHQS